MHVKMTHNVAEVGAARDSLAYLETEGYVQKYSTVVLRGDRKLTINFMLQKYKPGPDFNPIVHTMLNQCNEWKKRYRVRVHWEHMPRGNMSQQWADWLGWCARAACKDV